MLSTMIVHPLVQWKNANCKTEMLPVADFGTVAKQESQGNIVCRLPDRQL